MKNILFIGATHGDEPIGVRALENISSKREINWIIGNPKAYKQGQRFVEADLNRSAPGDASSELYEKRRAAKILEKSDDFEAIIDLHGTVSASGIFIIITNPTIENLDLATRLDVKRIVIWPAITPDLKSPLSEFFPVGLEIECGPKNDPAVQRQLENVIATFLDESIESTLAEKEIYQVYGEVRGPVDIPLEEFKEVEINAEKFTPLLINQYQNSYGVTCYKLRRVVLR